MSKKKNKKNAPTPATAPESVTIAENTDGENIVREVMAELPPSEPVQFPLRKKVRIPLTHRTWVKVLVFILTILFAAVTALSAIAAVFMVLEDVYTTSKSEFREDALAPLTEDIAYNVLTLVLDGREDTVVEYLSHRNVAGVSIIGQGSRAFTWQYGDTTPSDGRSVCESKWLWYQNNDVRRATLDSNRWLDNIYVSVYISEQLTEQDNLLLADLIVDAMYAMRYWIFAIAAAGLLLTILSFVFLMCASGRRNGLDEPQPGWGTRAPLDVLTAVTCIAVFLLLSLAMESFYYLSTVKQVITWFVCGIAAAVLVLGWCMSLAVRLKLGKWWENTAAFWAFFGTIRLLELAIRFVLNILRKCGRALAPLLRTVPLVWKTTAICTGIFFIDFLSVMAFRRDVDMLIVTWVLLHGAMFAGVMYLALILRRLQKGGDALASGDLGYQVDTKGMLPTFKTHAENLSRIGEGMTAAVEQRLKSERMKTELITNVSHDIKTPLTSIINYSDLIGKEQTENEKITEYAEVLHRQSERLKRLIDDLVEASKASTGNLDVLLAPCEVGVLLSQAAGEYEQRFEQCSLTLVTKQSEQPVKIMADGRRLWRVVDNLMNNICKYAMPGTRVYLTLEQIGNEAVISFKNTSREPLDLSADELMERFVRGDTARNSEGNGLGLAIARSLTQLQNGTLELTVDGDLFKAVLRFPTM